MPSSGVLLCGHQIRVDTMGIDTLSTLPLLGHSQSIVHIEGIVCKGDPVNLYKLMSIKSLSEIYSENIKILIFKRIPIFLLELPWLELILCKKSHGYHKVGQNCEQKN